MSTKKGQSIRFSASEVREMGTAAYGVAGIKLGNAKKSKISGVPESKLSEQDDEVVGVNIISKDEKERKDLTILTVTENGYGKRTTIDDYRLTGRACKGIINISCTERNGNVIGIELVKKDDSIIITTAKGIVIRTGIKDIREMGRNTQGVKIIRLSSGDSATSLVKVQKTAEGEEA